MTESEAPQILSAGTAFSSAMAGAALGQVTPQDEFLHPPAASGHYTSTETSYFGFNIPEQRINGEIYVWFHPVLKMMSASVYIWRGIRRSTLACDYINHFHYLPFPENDIGDYTIEPLGLHIRVVEPLKSVQIDMNDKERNVSFSLRLDAIMPPAIRPGGFHFTQAVKTSGELNLFGEKLTIDGYFSRDRSWSQERHETARNIPPMSWMVGIFDDSFAFHVLAFDDPARGPEWTDRYPHIQTGKNMIWGYVYRDGETYPVTSASKLTTREPDGLAPRLIEMDITDAGGEAYAIRGYVHARMPWQTWQNMNVFFCLTRWECSRGVGYGDTQDIQYNDFTHNFGRF